MSKKNIHNLLQQTVEEEVPADSVDLWPQIEPHIPAKPAAKPTRPRALRLALQITVIFLAGVAALLFTPQGRSLAQELLHYFKRADSDTYPFPTEVFITATSRAEGRATNAAMMTQHPEIPTATPTITPTFEPDTYMAANAEVTAIENQLGFDVLEPSWLPDNLIFRGANADLETGMAYQFYDLVSWGEIIPSNGVSIRQIPIENITEDEDCERCNDIGPSAEVKIVYINGIQGELVQGTWVHTDSETVWKSDPYIKRMRWEQDGMRFELGVFAPRGYISNDDLIAIAESLQ